jgi:hypothetical protein
MSAPLVPSPLDYVGRRSFGFYPAIQQAGPNIWILGAVSSWAEVQVINALNGSELWVPRHFVGAVSEGSDRLIVGLTELLRFENGDVLPCSKRRVLQMPPLPDTRDYRRGLGPGRVIAIRTERSATNRLNHAFIRIAIMLLFLAGLLALVTATSRVR